MAVRRPRFSTWRHVSIAPSRKPSPGDGHVGAGLGQRDGDRAAEVARAARDQRRAPGQVHRRLS